MTLAPDAQMASNDIPFLDTGLPAVLPNVDDLFGEDVDLNLAISSPSKELRQRIDDMRRRGCCQTVAWSRAGTIASITEDGLYLDFRYLCCDPDNGSWHFSEPTRYEPIAGSENNPLVHLAWSATATPELAVIDSVGRLTLLLFSVTLNRPITLRKWDHDTVDELNSVVGSHWLSLSPPSRSYNVHHGPAVRDNNRFRYENSFMHSFGPFHPNAGKSALLCATANGQLKLFFSQHNNRIDESPPMDLVRISCTDDLISHASICSDKNVLYVVLANTAKQLRLIRVNIQWAQQQSENKFPGTVPLNPSLSQRHLAFTSWHQPTPGDSPLDSAMGQISLLEIFPSTLEADAKSWAPPLILTVRSYLPSQDSPYQEVQSVIDRWQVLLDHPQSLHPAFISLGDQRSNQAPELQPTTRLQRAEPIVFNKVIIGIQTIHYGKVICITFSDGTVEYRDRITMSEVYNEPNTDRIMSLHQVGFSFPDYGPCLHAILSPTSCSMVQVCPDGEIKWKPLQYTQGDIGNTNQDPNYMPVLAGLAVAAGCAIHYVNCFDDVLAVARPFADKKRFAFELATEVLSMLKVNVDYSEDSHHDQLVRNTSLQMCYSILNHLGFRGRYQPRSFASKFATLALNARNIVILVTIASNTPPNIREKLSPLDEPEVVDALAGCAKWGGDLLTWLADSLFALLDDTRFMGFIKDSNNFPSVSAYLQEKNDVALHLLLCSSSRGLLVALCRRLMHLDTLGKNVFGYWKTAAAQAEGKVPNAALQGAYQRLQRVTASCPVRPAEFETLLNQLGADMRTTYSGTLARILSKATNQPPPQPGAAMSKQLDAAIKQTQGQCEMLMLSGGALHPMFRKALMQFFMGHLVAFRAGVDPAKLFFYDYSLLEVAADSRNSLEAMRKKGTHVDVFRRVEIVPGEDPAAAGSSGRSGSGSVGVVGVVWAHNGQWRRCVRCASVMEDLSSHSQRPGFSYVLMQQKKCSCGGGWGWYSRNSSAQ